MMCSYLGMEGTVRSVAPATHFKMNVTWAPKLNLFGDHAEHSMQKLAAQKLYLHVFAELAAFGHSCVSKSCHAELQASSCNGNHLCHFSRGL